MKGICTILVLALLLALVPVKGEAAELSVAGKSAVLMDVSTGTVLYESNAHQALAPASVTKIMTMLLIMEAVDSGKIALTDMVTASEAAAAKGGSQIYLKAGETMSVSDMLKSIAGSWECRIPTSSTAPAWTTAPRPPNTKPAPTTSP